MHIVPLLCAAVWSGPAAGADRIAGLVAQLGDASFARREAASRDLEALGENALPALRAATVSPDPEVRERAARATRAVIQAARTSKSLGLEMVVVRPGEFLMGSPLRDRSRRPDEAPHPVRITELFLLGEYEVTQDQYRRVTAAAPSWFAAAGDGKDKVANLDTTRFPVEQVSWFDAAEFCNRLSARDGYAPYYKLADVTRNAGAITAAAVTVAGGNGYRLPTEAEWEYACRARTATQFSFGFVRSGNEGNFKTILSTGYGTPSREVELGRTARVGSYPKNPWGLYDLHGNAGEWCGDWYDKDYYARSPADDPTGPADGTHRVVRGGSWLVTSGSCRSASRYMLGPGERNSATGFRVARTP